MSSWIEETKAHAKSNGISLKQALTDDVHRYNYHCGKIASRGMSLPVFCDDNDMKEKADLVKIYNDITKDY